MSTKRMTANPVKPARYRPGKPVAEEPSFEEEDDFQDEQEQTQQTPLASAPKASSFPSDTTRIAASLTKVDLGERKRQAAAEEAARVEAEKVARAAEEEGFVTEESEEEDSGEEESRDESGSGSEETSSEDEAPKKLLRPTFIKKGQRKDVADVPNNKEALLAEEAVKRQNKTDAMIEAQLQKDAAAKVAREHDFDDDLQDAEQVDDTDGLDPENERAAWKLRELKRVKREREAIEVAEQEREEIERRRNLSKEEREAEDKDYLDAQKENREGKGKMGYMQKYFHKGAFFQDDAKAEGLDHRDIMGSRFADDAPNRELLPQYMQIRDMTKLGRKGRTKYKDLKSEDTGKWGTFAGKRRADPSLDERFQPDRDVGGKGASGANATQVGERRRAPEEAPEDSRNDGPGASREGVNSYKPRDSERRRRSDQDDDRRRQRSYSYSRSPPSRRRDHSYSRSPLPRRARRRSYSYSRSPSPKSDRYHDNRSIRKRSPSPYEDRYTSDKRRRVDV